ncbi:MAG TPA: BACON domain-containing carbohydrate-binding protein [Bacteroidales bacterium]|nr:BACON domain-containing carbohydrate-binding protein [Bacteroidales bacterium]
MKRLLLLGAALLLMVWRSDAQFYPDPASGDTAHYPYWVTMMQDPNANFHATVSAFNKYWAGRTDYKGNGWKVFKRWEYIQSTRVTPDGKQESPDHVMKEYLNYNETHPNRSASGTWSIVGPVALPGNATSQPNGMGRINAIGFHPSDANTFYIGSPSGGFWKTADGATTWTCLSGTMPTLGVSSILIFPATPTTILIGTGDRDAGDAPGMGVYKSTDGGNTWAASNTGMGNMTVGMMILHPSNPSIILAATSGGIYKSIDGGSTWSKKSSNSNNYRDIKFKPGDPTIVYATEGGNFYRSTNTGDTWTQITSGIITGNRMVIGVSPSQPGYVYLCQTNGPFAGLLRSTDSGLNFTTQSTTPNIMDYSCNGSGTSSQAWYDLCIAVDPGNASIIYVGGINIFKSTNGGVNWTINSHWVGSTWGTPCAPSVHADVHTLEWSPVNGKLYTGCDGGIYYTSNGGTSWTDISSGLAIAQVYRIGQSATNQGMDMNGYQDNGTSFNDGTTFTTVIGGDGMECAIDYTDASYRYGELYYGSIYRTTGSWYSPINNNITESGGWVTPYMLHATDPNTMFGGFVNVWRTNNVKASNSGSVTWTAISSGESDDVSVLRQSPADINILYAERPSWIYGDMLKRTDNANAPSPTWILCTLPGSAAFSDLVAHPTNANIVYATRSNHVFKSTDKGMTWTDISGSLPNVTINTIVYDKNSNEGLYIGNRTGVYYKDAMMSDWVAFNSGLPAVDVRELEIYYDPANPGNNRLKAATYGRGLWQSDMMGALSVFPSNQDVPAAAGSVDFTVTAIGNWSTSSNASWCTVTPSGYGNGTITANYEENTDLNPRMATITVNGQNVSPVVVTVTQAGAAPTLNVQPPNQDVPYNAGSTSFSVTSNTSWAVLSNSSWCTVTPSGSGNGTIQANYEENTNITQRIDTITVTVSGLTPVKVTVTQSGAEPTLAVVPPNQDVTADAGTTDFTVTSNTDWTVISDAPWCTPTPAGTGNGTIQADYETNPDYTQRIATLTVTVSGISPQTVTVTQDASTVSVPDQSRNGIRIYPNPNDGSFRVLAGDYRNQTLEVSVLNMTGQTVYRKTCAGSEEYRIDLNPVPEGCYFVKVKYNEGIQILRLVISR